MTKYLLVYINEDIKKKHLDAIKDNLPFYLSSLKNQFVKNTAPLINDKFEILGNIIQIENNGNNENNGINEEEYDLNYSTDNQDIKKHINNKYRA